MKKVDEKISHGAQFSYDRIHVMSVNQVIHKILKLKSVSTGEGGEHLCFASVESHEPPPVVILCEMVGYEWRGERGCRFIRSETFPPTNLADEHVVVDRLRRDNVSWALCSKPNTITMKNR